jgi:hypothetical protein
MPKETRIIKDMNELPLGIRDGNSYNKTFSIKRWTMKQEREIGLLAEKNKDATTGRFVAMLIGTMFTRLGPWDFEKLSIEEKILKIMTMFSGDVMFLYCYMRYKSLGPEIDIKLACPNTRACGNEFVFKGDVGSIDNTCFSDFEESKWFYELKEPFEIRKKQINKFRLAPSRWNSYESFTDKNMKGFGDLKAKIFVSHIIGLNEEKESINLVDHELDEMGKADIETLSNKIDQNRLGPDLSIEAVCDNCKTKFIRTIPWEYTNFFGISSQ